MFIGYINYYFDDTTLLRETSKLWTSVAIATAISIILAAMSYRRQRRFGLPWTPLWTVLVLLFGVPAYIGYLAHRTWPARLPCPNCGQPAPRDRPACFLCRLDFPCAGAEGNRDIASRVANPALTLDCQLSTLTTPIPTACANTIPIPVTRPP